jgi:hypothetical protein
LRPWARRAASTRRPPVVFIRARKPCSLRDAASWADRSASSEGGYLSIRPRGQDTPKGTRTRLGATRKRFRRVCRRIICTCLRVSNGGELRGPGRNQAPNGPNRYSPEYTIRIRSKPCPEPLGRCYSSSARGARQPQGIGPRDREDCQTAPEERSGGRRLTAPQRRKRTGCPSRFWLSISVFVQD